VYYTLIQALKRRLVLELQDSFAQHPVYNKIVDQIQNKYAFSERPQYGIVVKGASGNKVALSADNFIGTISSHVMLATVGQPCYPLEWVREDLAAVRDNNDVMPVTPGIYYMEILEAPTTAQGCGQYILDPLLTATDEPVLYLQSGLETTAQLKHCPTPGTVRLYENHHFMLVEGTHYSLDYNTGKITLLTRANPGSYLTADYRFATESIGPIPFSWNQADFKTLPGVVMAFGKRARKGDKVAIVVYQDRVDTAGAYGGRFDATFEFDIISQDTNQTEEITDLAFMYLWAIKRPILSTEGIEITDVSMGGETEETYDETADLFYYNASMSIQMQADWEIHVPLPLTISRVTPATPAGLQALPDTVGQQSNIIGDVSSNLFFATVPVLAGRNNNFERIT